MKYSITKLDGRFSFSREFSFFASFHPDMSQWQGPLHFNRTLQWMIQTWGWSAEVHQWVRIRNHISRSNLVLRTASGVGPSAVAKVDCEYPPECNPHWSWSNRFGDLRIYLKGGEELSLFLLAHPVDQK
jgi:hypothetical protein